MTDLAWAGLLAGLTGGVHCVGMCGPFVAATGPGWHVGRFLAYLALGAAAGLGGRALPGGHWSTALAAVLLVWSSLRFGGFLHASEAGGLTRYILAASQRMRGLPPALYAVAMGALAALLPCGLFWSALGLATAAGDAAGGALVLAAFALGTLPALLAAGALLRRLATRARRVVALGVMAAGLFALAHRATTLPPAVDGLKDPVSAPSEAP